MTSDSAAGSEKGTFALISMPFTFIQDDLLNTDGFMREAEKRGHRLSLENLQTLHAAGSLVPFYYVSDERDESRRIGVVPNGNMNYRFEARQAASEGRLRNCQAERYTPDRPYRRPEGEKNPHWWNGYLYSSWQLLDVSAALRDRDLPGHLQADRARVRHERALVLTALAPVFLPGVLRQLRFPSGMDERAMERYRFDADLSQLLDAVGFDAERLRVAAEDLLLEAHWHDPLRDWLALVRYVRFSAWAKLRGSALDSQWLRVGAEVLLRAHEDLTEGGGLDPLPDLSGVIAYTPLADRLGRNGPDVESLEQVLGSFGLSPHPKVLLLVEGETELVHVPLLLEAFGLNRPDLVRVQQSEGSRVNPQLLARYAITPRLGAQRQDGWDLAAIPTALVIAMDPENKFVDEESRKAVRDNLRNAIREEVELQGGTIDDEQLDFLVNIHVWDEHLRYELANFTDDELLPAIEQLARGRLDGDRGTDDWRRRTRWELELARVDRKDIDVVIGKMRIKKPEFAKRLWPALLAKCEHELKTGNTETPILEVVLDVQRHVALLSGGSYVLPTAGPTGRDSAKSVDR